MTRPVEEIQMADPKTVVLVVDDGDGDIPDPILVQLDEPADEDWGTAYAAGYEGYTAGVRGADKKWLKLTEKAPTDPLERTDVWDRDDPTTASLAKYDTLDFGDATCTGITVESWRILEQFQTSPQRVQYRHFILFHLDQALADGTAITIENTANAFADVSSQTINFVSTFSRVIQVNSHAVCPKEPIMVLLSDWQPYWGDEGKVSLSATYGYFIRLSDNSRASENFPITLRQAADALPSTVSRAGAPGFTSGGETYQRLVSTTRHFPVADVTTGDPTVVEITGHDFEVGEYICFKNIQGVKSGNGRYQLNMFNHQTIYEITAVDGNNVTVDKDTSSASAYISGGRAYGTFGSNGSDVDIYECVVNTWDPQHLDEQYAFFVPGMGRSRPFYVSGGHSAALVGACLGAAAYNPVLMFDKDGRYGYEAPGGFNPNAALGDGHVPWYQSNATMSMTLEGSGSASILEDPGPPFRSWSQVRYDDYDDRTTEIFDVWGGVKDAGDPDIRISGQLFRVYDLCLIKDFVSDAAWRANLNYPNPTDIMDSSGQTFWAGTEVLSDYVKAAIVIFEYWRRLRGHWENGECGGGHEFTNAKLDPNAGSTRRPTWLAGNVYMALYYPEARSTFIWSAMAAGLGRTIKQEGVDLSNSAMQTLGQNLIDMAEVSYAKGEDIITNYATFHDNVNQINSDVFDSMVDTWTNEGPKREAACFLYRATGTAQYLTDAEDSGGPTDPKLQYELYAAGETSYGDALVSTADAYVEVADKCAVPNTRGDEFDQYYSNHPSRYAFPLAMAWKVSGQSRQSKFLRCIKESLSAMLGMHPTHVSWISGYGYEWATGRVEEDLAQIKQQDGWDGMGIFGNCGWQWSVRDFVQGNGETFWNFAPMIANPEEVGGNSEYRVPYPDIWQMPFFRARHELTSLIQLQEQTSVQAGDQAVMAAIRLGEFSNGVTTTGTHKRIG